MKKPSVYISKLIFSGGNKFQLKQYEKIILVGPNNSGKSQSLREIVAILQNGKKERSLVISEVDIKKIGTKETLKNFLDENAEFSSGTYRFQDWQIGENILRFWDEKYLLHGLTNGFVKKIAADDRLKICAQQDSISAGEQKSKPQHVLFDDEELMQKISALFKRAFGKDIMFDFRGGSKIPIHVGSTPQFDASNDRVSNPYVKAVRDNPLLDKQGDGMKSYTGILFEAIVSNRDITLIDEPEAFLHPPQMRKLGETLSSEVIGQLIVATHSSDILRGFLEGTQGNVRILRIRREEDSNIVSEASPLTIKELWEKPALRYSNALEGIFHEQTIICEDDSDCRLINSIADYLSTFANEIWQDTAYVPTGGKHAVHKVAGVLRKIGVPIKAVFDIDFLSEKELVESTVIAFGGQWEGNIEIYWNRIDAAVRKGVTPLSNEDIKRQIIEVLEDPLLQKIPNRKIIEIMKRTKPWAQVKQFGIRAIPNGESQNDFSTLNDKLEEIGIYLIPVGEIENYCPEIGQHGPKFVTKLLSEIPLGDEKLKDLHKFVERVHNGPHAILEKLPEKIEPIDFFKGVE